MTMHEYEATAAGARNLTALRPEALLPAEVQRLKQDIFSHPAMAALDRFGARLQHRPLSRSELAVFFASVGRFVLEIPPGIVALASRITDHYLTRTPFDALRMGARILFAAVDEYGLSQVEQRMLPTHHQLYSDMAAHWGLRDELTDANNMIPAAHEFALTIADHYRTKSIAHALGMHIGVETTAPIEFSHYLKGFRRFQAEYQIREGDPMLNFLWIHLDVEESHREMGLEMVDLWAQGNDSILSEVRDGAFAFMTQYGRFFEGLEARLFGETL